MYQILQKTLFELNFESFSTMLRTSFSKNNIFFRGGMCGEGRKKPITRKIQVPEKELFSTISSV